jgi:CheY-like chemotaxis protein
MTKFNRVLLIDDDKDDQIFLREALNELFPNMECISVNNGKAALDYIEKNPPPPKYIFLDLNMPYINGFEFLEEFKKENPTNTTTIYIYSTSSNPKDKEKAKKLGADDYITKFSDFDMLKVKLKNVVQLS